MEYIFVLNFNTFNATSIAKILRNNGVNALIKNGTDICNINTIENCKGIIICGDYALSLSGIELDKNWLNLQLPVLTIGSSTLALNAMFGGKTEDTILNDSFAVQYPNYKNHPLTLQSTAYIIAKPLLPGDRMKPFAIVNDNTCIGIKHVEKEIYGLQRKFERNDPQSIQLLLNFATEICHYSQAWNVEEITSQYIQDIQTKYSSNTIFSCVCPGVESAVATNIFKQAFPNSIHCIFVDTGLYNDNEVEETAHFYKNILKLPFSLIDMKEQCLSILQNSEESTQQNDEIVYNKVREALLQKIKVFSNALLIYGAAFTKSQVFWNELQSNENFKEIQTINPLQNLFVFEVENLAESYMLPDEIINNSTEPFLGIASQIYGKITEEKINILKDIYQIYYSEINEVNITKKLWKYSVALMPHVALPDKFEIYLRAWQNTQNPLSYPYRMPYDLLERVSNKILHMHPRTIRHILYDLTPIENLNNLE